MQLKKGKFVVHPAFTVAVLNTKKLPSGTSLETKTATLAATGIATPLIVTAAGTAANDVTTVVTVPTGTVMKDANGTTLSGNVTAQVVSFNATENAAFFPGGLRTDDIVLTPNAAPVAGIFSPAAFASVSMTVGGTAVKSFTGQKVEVKMTLDKDAINANTRKAYAANDDIDVFSYNTTTGQWTKEATTKVQAGTNGSLMVLHETSHLSYFMNGNVSFISKCSNNASIINHTVTWQGTAETVDISVTVSSVNDDTSVSSISGGFNFTLKKNGSFPLESFVSTTSIYVYIWDKSYNLLSTNSGVDLCTPQTFNLGTINAPTVTLNFTASCSGIANIEAPTGTQVQYRDGNSTGEYKVLYTVGANRLSATRGAITTTLLTVGNTYDFKVVAGSLERFRNDVAITSANMSFNSELQSAVCELIKAR